MENTSETGRSEPDLDSNNSNGNGELERCNVNGNFNGRKILKGGKIRSIIGRFQDGLSEVGMEGTQPQPKQPPTPETNAAAHTNTVPNLIVTKPKTTITQPQTPIEPKPKPQPNTTKENQQ